MRIDLRQAWAVYMPLLVSRALEMPVSTIDFWGPYDLEPWHAPVAGTAHRAARPGTPCAAQWACHAGHQHRHRRLYLQCRGGARRGTASRGANPQPGGELDLDRSRGAPGQWRANGPPWHPEPDPLGPPRHGAANSPRGAVVPPRQPARPSLLPQ